MRSDPDPDPDPDPNPYPDPQARFWGLHACSLACLRDNLAGLPSDDVRRALCDARLEALLREIDSCPSRERALRRLEEALADPDFEAFTELVLKAVGYERDGGGEAPARRRARLAAEAAALAAAEEDQLEGDESGEDDGEK